MKPVSFATLIQSVLITLLLSFVLTVSEVSATDFNSADLMEGEDYHLISPPIPPSGDKPEIVEVFNFHCPHCYYLHPHFDRWAKQNSSRFTVKALPIFWGNQSDIPARAYYTAEFMGKGIEMKDAIFKARFVDGIDIDNFGELIFVVEAVGLDPDLFKQNMKSFGVIAKLAQARTLKESYGVSGTPMLVVNGKYRVPPSSGKSLATPEELASDDTKWNGLLRAIEALAVK
ncbi:MAG: thiol:disulfide interchange protein DsbA/DsbL [Magnetococcales bacterium]|nr:thiol:disulfide interchange protein DsbA/DsbL [Magnetococcales bacterium]